MADTNPPDWIEEQIAHWRSDLRRHLARTAADGADWETPLRTELAALRCNGLPADEAFLLALKRLGGRGGSVGELARERSARVWKQLVASAGAPRDESGLVSRDGVVAFSLAVLAAVAIKVPVLFGVAPETHEGFYFRNASLFVLPWVIGFFVWKRRPAARTIGGFVAAFVAAAIVANLPGFGAARAFQPLTTLHLPIALLLAVGVAHAGGCWREVGARMDFIQFSGELFIYYVLIALGGGVLTAFTVLTFKSIGIHIESFIGSWLLPCGAAGAVVIASWLVEAKKRVLENMAPLLTRLFTPLFAVMLVAFLGALLVSGRGIAFERDLLIGFDLLLVVVLGLLLYSLSARDPAAPPGTFDVLQVVLVISALLADAVALWAIGARIHDFGFSPNRVAALGENVILLVNLAGSAVLYCRFLLRRGSLASLERWQTGYLPIYAAWSALVVLGFPLLFRGMT